MTRFPFDETWFRSSYPELKIVEYTFLRQQWNLADQYISQQPTLFRLLTEATYMKLVAHLVKLNLMAQTGLKVVGKDYPVLTPPRGINDFKEWLDQTQYGRALG